MLCKSDQHKRMTFVYNNVIKQLIESLQYVLHFPYICTSCCYVLALFAM